MPPKCLVENIVEVVALLFPTCHGKADFQRDWFALPNVLDSSAHYLLWVDLQHFGRKVRICGARPHVSQTIQSPSRAMFRAIRERLLLVKIHQQRRALKRIEPNIDKFFLMDKRSEEHTSELQSHSDLVCRLLLEKKKNIKKIEQKIKEQRS